MKIKQDEAVSKNFIFDTVSSPQKRFRVVSGAFALFALLALFVFGQSIYNIYNYNGGA